MWHFIAIALILFVFPNGQSLNLNAGAGSWSQLVVAFITGITTGGLSCLAVQGGLLVSSLAHQIEQDYVEQTAGSKNKKASVRSNSAFPIFLFLVSKLIAYTLLGALLGWLGSFLTLSPMTRAMLMIAIGIFMIGNALRMFNVHPIFRYFSVEPPKFITRYIRRTAKGTDTFTPSSSALGLHPMRCHASHDGNRMAGQRRHGCRTYVCLCSRHQPCLFRCCLFDN
ncbi:MAG: sulfite exporter TauE/SafE family protein [Anaerolineales bacterium]|uniref:urease accessory protein UreH domain-containing protein n=1 Tax=Candidatus Villigracilis proximus TaxID=3140683 RepID=UPI00313701E5|nr:sulfite exporter TauE/SafE family protein [Anaerolineales bacterium]